MQVASCAGSAYPPPHHTHTHTHTYTHTYTHTHTHTHTHTCGTPVASPHNYSHFNVTPSLHSHPSFSFSISFTLFPPPCRPKIANVGEIGLEGSGVSPLKTHSMPIVGHARGSMSLEGVVPAENLKIVPPGGGGGPGVGCRGCTPSGTSERCWSNLEKKERCSLRGGRRHGSYDRASRVREGR